MTGTPHPADAADHQGTQGRPSDAVPSAPDDPHHAPGHRSTRAPLEHACGRAPQDDDDPGDSGPRQRIGRALVVTASNRAAAGVYADRGGPLIIDGLRTIGFTADGPTVVPDGDPVEQALRDGVRAGYDVIVTTGGTGISPTDSTPEATRKVIDHEVPGIAEAIRAFGRQKVPTASLSRGLAGVAGRTLIVNLPGSTGGVKDGLTVLEGLLPHAVEQLRGTDHPGSASSTSTARLEAPPSPEGGEAPSRSEGSGGVSPGGAH